MKRLMDLKRKFRQTHIEMLLDDSLLELVKEYCLISSKQSLSEQDADRLEAIISQAEDDGRLDFWLDEADHFLAHELCLSTGKTLYPFETENQKAVLREHLEFWSKRYLESDEAVEMIKEIEEFIESGSFEVQKSLQKKGFDPGPIDGVVGPRTQDAIMRFQRAHNLAASGKIDDDTQLALGCMSRRSKSCLLG